MGLDSSLRSHALRPARSSALFKLSSSFVFMLHPSGKQRGSCVFARSAGRMREENGGARAQKWKFDA